MGEIVRDTERKMENKMENTHFSNAFVQNRAQARSLFERMNKEERQKAFDDYTKPDGWTMLNQCARDNDVDMAKLILEISPFDIYFPFRRSGGQVTGTSDPFHIAFISRSNEVLEYFIDFAVGGYERIMRMYIADSSFDPALVSFVDGKEANVTQPIGVLRYRGCRCTILEVKIPNYKSVCHIFASYLHIAIERGGLRTSILLENAIERILLNPGNHPPKDHSQKECPFVSGTLSDTPSKKGVLSSGYLLTSLQCLKHEAVEHLLSERKVDLGIEDGTPSLCFEHNIFGAISRYVTKCTAKSILDYLQCVRSLIKHGIMPEPSFVSGSDSKSGCKCPHPKNGPLSRAITFLSLVKKTIGCQEYTRHSHEAREILEILIRSGADLGGEFGTYNLRSPDEENEGMQDLYNVLLAAWLYRHSRGVSYRGNPYAIPSLLTFFTREPKYWVIDLLLLNGARDSGTIHREDRNKTAREKERAYCTQFFERITLFDILLSYTHIRTLAEECWGVPDKDLIHSRVETLEWL